MKRYSVLLRYAGTTDYYFTHVDANNQAHAIEVTKAMAIRDKNDSDETDLEPVAVFSGWAYLAWCEDCDDQPSTEV